VVNKTTAQSGEASESVPKFRPILLKIYLSF